MTSLWFVAAILTGRADAAPECEPLDEAEFRSYVLDAQSGIDRGDIELPAAILWEVQSRIECLTFAPQPRMWADLLVAMAIVEFGRGGDWQSPLAAALRIRPAIDRGVGGGHPISSWTPDPAPMDGEPVPERARIWVDGMRATNLPPADGMWLVQRTDGRYWNTLLLIDEPVPEGWAADTVEQPPRIRGWARVGGVLGAGTLTQDSSWDSDIYVDLPIGEVQGPSIGVAGDAQVTVLSAFGVLLQGSLPLMRLSQGLEGRIAAIGTWRRLTLGAGLGTTQVGTYEAVDDEVISRVQQLRYPMGTLLLRPMRPIPWDVALSTGAGGSVGRTDLGVGLLLPSIGGETFRASLNVTSQVALFGQPGLADRVLESGSSRALLRLDWVWGEY